MNPQVFLQDLALVLCAAGITTVACQRLHLPVVLGYLVAGIAVGPHTPIPFFAHEETVRTLAELGVILLMFSLGLEFNLRTLARIVPTSGVVALIEVGLTFALGFQVAALFGLGTRASLLAGAVVSISSTMIVTHAFRDLRFEQRARETVFGILIAEDLVAILMLAATSALAARQGDPGNILLVTTGKLILVVALLLGAGLVITPSIFRRLVALRSRETLLVTSVGFCFALALFARAQGLSIALGAFIAGALISEANVARHVEPSSSRSATCSRGSSSCPSGCSSIPRPPCATGRCCWPSPWWSWSASRSALPSAPSSRGSRSGHRCRRR